MLGSSLPDASLVRLRDVSRAVDPLDVDIRDHWVRSTDGSLIGRVDALYIDVAENRVRYLDVRTGGLLGIGQAHVLVPVESIGLVSYGEVWLAESGPLEGAGPPYDPEVLPDPALYSGHYRRRRGNPSEDTKPESSGDDVQV